MKLLTVVGARPQFIKAAAVSRAIAARADIEEVIVHTGQHYDANMSDVFFTELSIPRPDHHLGIGGGLHGAMTGRQLEALEVVIIEECPDWVLVYGDTNSTLAGALAAAKLHIPVAHVEAGLRSYNRRMPEEINRVLTDHSSSLLFAPTETAVANLIAEGISPSNIVQVGDVMYDVALFYRDRAACPAWFEACGAQPGGFILATVHRAENTDDLGRLSAILQGLSDAGRDVVLPLHPRTKERLSGLAVVPDPRILIVPPASYLEMVWLEASCAVVATDSGGVQKEAYFHGKPCVTLRDETEWTELLGAGVNMTVGADAECIADALRAARMPDEYPRDLYGDGDSAAAIVDWLMRAARS
jgi:UDP-GlcNAc3NAcA epimerase